MAGKYTAHHPKPANAPGVNWVERVGGLPGPIDAVARALLAKGWSQSRAIATAVNHVRKVCATGRAFGGKTKVSAEARATACRAAAEWEAKKAQARALSMPARERRVMDLAFARIDGEPVELPAREVSEDTMRHALIGAAKRGLTIDLSRIDMATPRAGLVATKVTVHRKNGTTFQRTMYLRPKQAKAVKSQKGGRQVSVKGSDVQRQERGVLEELAKIPRAERPAGWDEFVRQVAAGPTHGGRLGPAKRKALRDLQKNAPDGSPLKAAVTGLLQSDAKPKATPKPKAPALKERSGHELRRARRRLRKRANRAVRQGKAKRAAHLDSARSRVDQELARRAKRRKAAA